MTVELQDKETQKQEISRLFLHQRISLLVIGLLFSAAWFYLTIIPERPGQTLMEFESVEPLSPTDICPGHVLRYQVDLRVEGEGIFDYDLSIWRISPPMTVIFSTPQRVVFSEEKEFTVIRELRLPEEYVDPGNGALTPWLPGEYELRFALSTPSRSTKPSIEVLSFRVLENCPSE